ncbi:Peptidoglycan-associated lipoprotein [Nitrospira sp. KM1]|uniref:OmpA family protein n=1 Tax=Nitrospira sp. KM1 TaxID=1936990 RepID=UPI0013A73E09|nr:OmpA family protein [Nitrospira sp. KM1]BCA55616.1 Peptidoglycan-associated lipoprotein [Nitrospira sp. KM1]
MQQQHLGTKAFMLLSIIVLFSQGCGVKWLQSDGDSSRKGSQSSRSGDISGTPWDGKGINPAFPLMTQRENATELSGFSGNPAEERLMEGSGISSKYQSARRAMQRAELTQEERAAIEAGLQDVFFAYDQWSLSKNSMESLDHNAEWLKAHPGAVMRVEGHCDERGTADYNVVLGEKRSKSARAYLLELGVSQTQLGTVSYGKERPFCLDHTEACYRENRRGHMWLRVKK